VNPIEEDVVLGADRAPRERDKLRFPGPREMPRPCILPESSLRDCTSRRLLVLDPRYRLRQLHLLSARPSGVAE
jgi:hypothetical protein